MSQATMTTKGQVTVPKAIRDHLKLRAGDRLSFIVAADGSVTIRPMTASVTTLKGIVPAAPRVVTIEEMNQAIKRRGTS